LDPATHQQQLLNAAEKAAGMLCKQPASGLPAESTAAAAVLLAVELLALFMQGWAYFND